MKDACVLPLYLVVAGAVQNMKYVCKVAHMLFHTPLGQAFFIS